MTTTGIYKIQSLVHPDRIYVGSAVDIKRRWVNHLLKLKNNKSENSKIQNHYNKYGKGDLQFSIIESFDFISKEHLLSREQHYIDTLKPFFNIVKIAGSNLGFKHSKETIEKNRKSHLGTHPTKEAKENMSKSKIGNINGSGNKGNHPTEEIKELLRQLNLGNTHGTGNKGKKHTEITKHKSSQGHILYYLEKELTNYINDYQ
jgi:group I intron endonuclease